MIFFCASCDINTEKPNYDYSIDQSLVCFCPPDGTVRVFVKSDSISDVISLSDNVHLEKSRWSNYRTIKGLFNEITTHDTARFFVNVEMDQYRLYPTLVSINPKPVTYDSVMIIISDAGYSYITSNYKILR